MIKLRREASAQREAVRPSLGVWLHWTATWAATSARLGESLPACGMAVVSARGSIAKYPAVDADLLASLGRSGCWRRRTATWCRRATSSSSSEARPRRRNERRETDGRKNRYHADEGRGGDAAISRLSQHCRVLSRHRHTKVCLGTSAYAPNIGDQKWFDSLTVGARTRFSGDLIGAHARNKAANSLSIVMYVFDVCRFENGRLVEHWGVPDRLHCCTRLARFHRDRSDAY
jgi:hypothetical protein